VIDENLFTEKITSDWKEYLLNSYEDVFLKLKSRIDPSSPISFFISKSLIEEIIVDVVIGLKKITNSPAHHVRFPNAFKIAAHLSYWLVRHKPVSIHYPAAYFLENVKITGVEDADEKTAETERQKLIWRLKHINELVAVQLVMTFIFCLDKAVCGKKECKRIKKSDSNITFDDFEDMKAVILQKLTYYFAYRPITPKVIEHILEGYTFHPAWALTGRQWAVEEAAEE
jgi:hypothetical protein